MTTYCLNPNETRLAVYNLNTWTMPTNNIVFSHITANLSNSATSIAITSWEWALFTWWMIATIEQLNSDWKATAREVVLISWINWNTLSIVRWYEKCVMNDLASPKVLWNTPQTFTSWAKISVYISRALLNWVQTRLQQINCPCNTCVYNQALEVSSCVLNNCDDRRDKLLETKACCCYNDKWFWSWCDWDCTMSWNVFLCANREYEFNNLTIEEWACVRFEWQWVPTIRVKKCFCNMWVIDLRWWTFVWCCSATDVYSSTTVWNNADSTAYNSMCFWCWWIWWSWWCVWWNATSNCWWDWWNAQNWCAREPATCADWFNKLMNLTLMKHFWRLFNGLMTRLSLMKLMNLVKMMKLMRLTCLIRLKPLMKLMKLIHRLKMMRPHFLKILYGVVKLSFLMKLNHSMMRMMMKFLSDVSKMMTMMKCNQ